MSVKTDHIISLYDIKLITRTVVGENIQVLDFSLKPYSEERIGFLGAHQRLKIRIKRSSKNDDETIFCFVKALPADNLQQLEFIQESLAFDKEVGFYSKILPQLSDDDRGPIWCPRCYLIKNNTLCFEDLALHGFGMRDKLFDELHVRAALRAIASLHASSIRAEVKLGKSLKDLHPDDFYEMIFVKEKRIYEWFTAGVSLTKFLAEKMGLDASRLPETLDRLYKGLLPSETKVNVVSHGDLWANNILFDDKLQCKLVDFQAFRYCPIGLDLAQFLYLCAPNELRRNKERDLISCYHKFILEFLGDDYSRAPSLDQVFQSYDERKVAGCITAVWYFPTILLDGVVGQYLLDDSDKFQQFALVDRRQAVTDYMEKDVRYKERLEAAVEELVEMSFKLDELPVPC